MKNFYLILLGTIFLSFFNSCKKAEPQNNAVADVFVRSLTHNGLVGYTVEHVVTSSDQMSSVTVDTPDGVSFSLSQQNSLGTAFFKDTTMAGLYPSQQPPAHGLYTYHVKFASGDQKIFTNTLSNNFILPPVIDSLYVTSNGLAIRIKWEPVAGADAYQIRITSGHNVIYPWLQFADPSGYYTERLISYLAAYLPGTITFELMAVKYESDDEEYVQSVGYSSASIDL